MGKLLVANYKMKGDKKFFRSVNILNKIKCKDTTLVLCPPFVYLPSLKPKRFSLGAQNVCDTLSNTTGEIDIKMLVDCNVKYVIVGHSERRTIGETDEQVANKVNLALEYGITPIVCVGERYFRSGTDEFVAQVKSVLSNARSTGEIIFAYEPIWAIGTGKIPTIKRINKAISLIKSTASELGHNCKVLYGGSVNVDNYRELLTSEADGFLVGGLSLKLDYFVKVLKGIDE